MPISIKESDLRRFDTLNLGDLFFTTDQEQDPGFYVVTPNQILKEKNSEMTYSVVLDISGSGGDVEMIYLPSDELILDLKVIVNPIPGSEMESVIERADLDRTDVDDLIIQDFSDLANNTEFFPVNILGLRRWADINGPILEKRGDIEYQFKGQDGRYFAPPSTKVVTMADFVASL